MHIFWLLQSINSKCQNIFVYIHNYVKINNLKYMYINLDFMQIQQGI